MPDSSGGYHGASADCLSLLVIYLYSTVFNLVERRTHTLAAGGMLIALAVIAGWAVITWEHVTKLMGRHASDELVRKVKAIADAHHPQLKRDALRCYHAGEGVLVELEVSRLIEEWSLNSHATTDCGFSPYHSAPYPKEKKRLL